MKGEVHHFLKIPKYLMITTGQWNFNSEDGTFLRLYKKFRYVPLMHWSLLVQTFVLSIFINWSCKVNLIQNIFDYLHSILNVIVVTLLNSKATKKVLASIYNYENFVLVKESEEINRIYSGYVKQNDRIAKFYIFAAFVAGVFWTTSGIRAKLIDTEQCHFMKGLVFQIWYPFDVEEYKWIGHTFDIYFMIGAVIYFTYPKVMTIVMMLYVVARLKVVQQYVETLDSDVEELKSRGGKAEETCRSERIGFVLRRHQEAISIMESVETSNKMVTIILFYGSVLDLPSYIIQMLFGERYLLPKNFGILVFSLASIYVFCNVANSIIIESTNIANVIYEKTKWISYDKRDKSSLALMILRSQMPLKLEAVTIGVVSLETFLKILKLCYTTTTYFATVYK